MQDGEEESDHARSSNREDRLRWPRVDQVLLDQLVLVNFEADQKR
jgi:hypothetical protein